MAASTKFAAATVAIALSACASATPDLTVTAVEYSFSPTSWSAVAGEEFSVELTNDGFVEHEWAVVKLGQDLVTEDDFTEDKVLFEIEKIAADTATTQSFTVADAGTYQVICALEGHFAEGMVGTLVVE